MTKREIQQRFWEHKNSAKKDSGYLLHRAIRKHGEENFLIEEICTTDNCEHAKELERKYIQEFNSFCNGGHGYNLTIGGDGVWGLKHTEETKLHLSKKKLEMYESRPEMREAQAARNLGKKQSAEHRASISDALKDHYRKHPRVGKPHTEEHRKNISLGNKGVPRMTQEQKEKNRERMSQKWEITYPDGRKEIITNLKKFGETHGIWYQSLWKVAKGELKTANGGYKCKKLD